MIGLAPNIFPGRIRDAIGLAPQLIPGGSPHLLHDYTSGRSKLRCIALLHSGEGFGTKSSSNMIWTSSSSGVVFVHDSVMDCQED